MTKLFEDVGRLEREELERASAKFGPRHNSAHEAYAVILEEFNEADEDRFDLEESMKMLWKSVRHNMLGGDVARARLSAIMGAALRCAAEMIQVAAMADKAMRGFVCEDEK